MAQKYTSLSKYVKNMEFRPSNLKEREDFLHKSV